MCLRVFLGLVLLEKRKKKWVSTPDVNSIRVRFVFLLVPEPFVECFQCSMMGIKFHFVFALLFYELNNNDDDFIIYIFINLESELIFLN